MNETIKFYDQCQFVYGSVGINYVDNKKKLIFPKKWKTQKDSFYNKKINGAYIKTGKESDIFVIDIDNLEKPEAEKIYNMSMKECNLITKTRKGYHFYYRFNKKLDITSSFKQYGFDIRANGGVILCPPSKYKIKKDETFEYTFIKKNSTITEISDELETYIIKLLEKPLKQENVKKEIKKYKNLNKFITTEIVNNDEIALMKEVINNISVDKIDEYATWILMIWALLNSGYDEKMCDYLSRRSKNYNETNNYEYYKKAQKRNENENKVTIALLWYYLKEDNIHMFYKLQKKKLEMEYNKKYNNNTNRLKDEKYKRETMLELFRKDIMNIKNINYYNAIIEKTASFKYFNKFHFYVNELGKYYIQNYVPGCVNIINIGNDLTDYKDINVLYEGKKYYFKDCYIESTKRRRYNKFDFIPSMDEDEEIFNLFKGFKYDSEDNEYDESEIKIFIDHIKYICGNEKETYEYLLNWCAHIVQRPYIKTDVAVVLYSITEGIGKNLFTQLLEKIFDGYYGEFTNQDFDNQFNSKFKNKSLMIGNEINARAKRSADYLKDIITRTEITINEKYVNTYRVKDYCNFIFTTNHEVVFKISNTDRRYLLIECPIKKQTNEYYTNYVTALNNEKKLKQFYAYLKNRNIKKFNIRKIPINEYKKRNIMYNAPAYIQMIRDNIKKFNNKTFTASELYEKFQEYAREKKLESTMTKQTFYIQFKKIFKKYYVRDEKSFYKFKNLTESTIDELIETKFIGGKRECIEI
jgi:hypothetical protein